MYFYDAKTNQWIQLRDTAEYKKRRKIVRDCWIFVAIGMLQVSISMIIVLALFSTFVSFMFLDESKYGARAKQQGN